MIPRIQTGTSFKGAELYYLHDKRAEGEAVRETKERVAWTYAINTLENEPDAVLAEMRLTAFNQYLLKFESGNRVDGRPTERPVMTVALSWPRGENPTREDMIEAGRSFLRHMKWDELQTLFVGHNDTKHSHVHLIINRVHPETGMTQDAAWTKHRSQQWALAYEREHGKIYCEKRERKYGSERAPAPKGMNQNEWKLWQEIAKDGALDPGFEKFLQAGEWDALKGGQHKERVKFWKEASRLRKELRTAVWESVKAEFAPQWAAYAQEKEKRDAKLKLYDRETRNAIRQLRKQRGGRTAKTKEIALERAVDGRTYIRLRRKESDGIEQIKERRKAYHRRHREELFQMRSAIATRQKVQLGAMVDSAMAQFSADHKKQYNQVLANHRDEKADLRKDQRAGERRRDVLPGLPTGGLHLTPEQTAGYIAQAREFAKAGTEQFDKTRREIAHADRARQTGQDPQAQKAEAHDRTREKKDKDQAQEGKRLSDREWYLAKRKADRDRDRDGGRDR